MKTDEIMTLADTYWNSAGPNMAAHRNSLQSAIEALQKDAERYRWLRHGDNDEPCLHFTKWSTCGTDHVWLLRETELDAAIDAAMALDKP